MYRSQYAAAKPADLFMEQKQIPLLFAALEKMLFVW